MPEGVYVSRVMENGGAEKAGITKGCIITGIEGSGINNMESLQETAELLQNWRDRDIDGTVPGRSGRIQRKRSDVTLTEQLS